MLSKSIGYRQSMISGKGAASPSGTKPTYSVTYTPVAEHYANSTLYNQIDVLVDSSLGSGNVIYAEITDIANSKLESNTMQSSATDANGNVSFSFVFVPTSYDNVTDNFTINIRTGDPTTGEIVNSQTGNLTSTTANVTATPDPSYSSSLTTGTANGKTYYRYIAWNVLSSAGDQTTTGKFETSDYVTVNVFAVAGGGAGGAENNTGYLPGGGGAGAVYTETDIVLTATSSNVVTAGGGGLLGYYGANTTNNFSSLGANEGNGSDTVVFGTRAFGGGRGGYGNLTLSGANANVTYRGTASDYSLDHCANIGNVSAQFTGSGGGQCGEISTFVDSSFFNTGGIAFPISGNYPYNYDICSEGNVAFPAGDNAVFYSYAGGGTSNQAAYNNIGCGGGGASAIGANPASGSSNISGGAGIVNNYTGANITYARGGNGMSSSTSSGGGGTSPGSLIALGHGGYAINENRTAGYENSGGGGIVILQLQGNVNHSVVLD